MMNKTIYIKYMTEEALETLKQNAQKVVEEMKSNNIDSSWLKKFFGDKKIFEEKKYKIEDFTLEISDNYKDVDYKNSITLYEHLKHLPMHILTNERFWAWLNFEKFYSVAMRAIPVEDKTSTFLDHYTFARGLRRGIFFGVLSRCYFRVALSIDESLNNKYELTKFVIDNPQRFRNLTWRTYSSRREIVLGTLKAEKKYYDEFGEPKGIKIYDEVSKYISTLGSVMLLDSFDEEQIFDLVYKKMKELTLETCNL